MHFWWNKDLIFSTNICFHKFWVVLNIGFSIPKCFDFMNKGDPKGFISANHKCPNQKTVNY